MEIFRIIKNQTIALHSYHLTQNKNQAEQFDFLIKKLQPINLSNWHPYIAMPFKRKPPHPPARFRPAHGRTVFYASFVEETALYEKAFKIMSQRIHLKEGNISSSRTMFSANADSSTAIDVNNISNQLMDKNDYTASHQFISATSETFIIYPSCRDRLHRNNAAILDINHLAKNPNWESPIQFFYDDNLQQITWLDNGLTISWQEVN